MKTLYIECSMGAAGDMLTAALIELLPDREGFVKRLNSLGIPGVSFRLEDSVKCGIKGSHMTVLVNGEEESEEMHGHHHEHDHHEHEHHHDHHDHEHDHDHDHHEHHHHTSMHDIEHIISHIGVPENVREDILAVYRLIAEAESAVHGKPFTEIHFHEVGTMDAVADITAVCLLMNEIKPDRIVASPVHVGSGSVKCAHGILPVPAPATANILKDIPIYGGEVRGELCTPTGAALLKHFAEGFGEMPLMRVSAVGIGMGRKDFERANCLRAMLGESGESREDMFELSCDLDDMTAEDMAYAAQKLYEGGAAEVFTLPIGMKKSRPGTMLTVICSGEKREEMVRLIFRHTSTIGVREKAVKRYVLDRRTETLETELGTFRKKVSQGFGVTREKIEHDDLAAAADRLGISIDELRKRLADGRENG